MFDVTRKFTVEIEVTAFQGSTTAAAIYQGYGPEWIKAYLATKMPAGSPVEITDVKEA